MSTRERIMTIRLVDKVSKHPMYAASLGIEIMAEMVGKEDADEPP